jgi:hypothetical protein
VRLDHPTGHFPRSASIGDLNDDGTPDLVTVSGDSNRVSVLINTPGLCAVQDVGRRTLLRARLALLRANCRVGAVRRAFSQYVHRGLVASQMPKLGTVRPAGTKVNLVISRGPGT